MEAYVKPFVHQNKLFIKIKNLESEDQADFVLKSAIAGLRKLDKDPDLIFDLRGYEVSDVTFEYEYMRRFLLVMCLKSPRSIIRIGKDNFLQIADEVIKALNVRLDSLILTSDNIDDVKAKLKLRGEKFEELAGWFDKFDFNTIVDNEEDRDDPLLLDSHLSCNLGQPVVEIRSLSVTGEQKAGAPLQVKVDAVTETGGDIYFRYFYKQNTLEKHSASYNFPDDQEWTKKKFCRFVIEKEGRYQFFVEAASDPSFFDCPDSSYAILPLNIKSNLKMIADPEKYFYSGQNTEIILLTKDMKKKVIRASVQSYSPEKNTVELISLEPELDFREYKSKFVLSCVSETLKGIYRYAFKAELADIEKKDSVLRVNQAFKVLYQDYPKKVNLRNELRYKVTEKDNIILYIYNKGGLFSSGKVFEVADISVSGFGIVLNSASDNSLPEMDLNSIVKTQIILTPSDNGEPVIISPQAEVRWKSINFANDSGKIGFKFADDSKYFKEEIQNYISLRMV
jgi:c-di-GMP-binding flagellar brake protein YcgR